MEQLRSEYYQEPYEGYAHWAGHHPELVIPPIDVSREIQSKQLALSLQDEVIDLEAAGIHAIQVDEPTIREGLPLRKEDWDAYLTWAVDSFRLATAGVKDVTQTHSHFCYSDFNDIFPSIQRLDADVISIEASKSDMKLLTAFRLYRYKKEIGPGVYDIHSPCMPSTQEIKDRIQDMLGTLPNDLLFVNPDCGLKTRAWKETEGKVFHNSLVACTFCHWSLFFPEGNASVSLVNEGFSYLSSLASSDGEKE